MGRVELLCYGDERSAVFVKRLHDPGEIEERPTESIDFVDNDAIDLSGGDVRQQPIEARPVHAATRKPAVVVVLGQAGPTFVLLAGNVRLARFALRVERIEF